MDCKAYWRATELRAMGKSNLFQNLDSKGEFDYRDTIDVQGTMTLEEQQMEDLQNLEPMDALGD